MYNAIQLKKNHFVDFFAYSFFSSGIVNEYFLINDLHLNSAQEAQRRALLRLESSSLQLSR